MDPLRRNNVNIVGNPDAGRTLLFSHGFGSDQSTWQSVWPSFADRFRIVLFDHVKHRTSDPAAFSQHRYLSLRNYALDLLDLCRDLRLRDVVAVGHSMGAMIALLASIQHPEHFSRLVLIGASARYVDDDGYRGGFSPDDLASTYRAILENYRGWVGQFAPLMVGDAHPENFTRDFARSLGAMPMQSALTVACSIFQSDHRADLPHVSRPTLIVQTRNDPAVPPQAAQYLAEHIPGSQYREIDTTGHLPHVTAPDAVIAAMRDFVLA